eukprot:CAMPEP_0179054514 /NCGR_PEP_ID=MMETSP0796-20121207/22825_1 /TAXON_ID=73915 /ORGANISM="Pyrodinium bahamense, Strain pbaha01" /LENGTH=309 /DNA_ID=CAMNT_0020751139 /DNA_START=62 /DNA_END=989 /DNA_ORIENTATION=-
MGGTINAVAFPAPQLPRHFYEAELLPRQDLVWLTTSAGERIPACYVQARPSSDLFNGPRMTLLYSHGNAEDLGLHLDYIDALSRHTGADVFSYEYVGYSLSRLDGGEASEAACLRSIDAAWRYCVDEAKIHPKRVVIYGRSIGSGPSVDLASRDSVQGSSASPKDAGGVLLQSPLESGARAILGHFVSFIGYPLDIFRNYEKIGKISAPVAIMHGTADEVIPVANGKALHQQLQCPYEPLWVEGYGHNNMPQDIASATQSSLSSPSVDMVLSSTAWALARFECTMHLRVSSQTVLSSTAWALARFECTM